MNFIGTERLETKRLILRRFEVNDFEDMFENWASDNEVTKYLSWSTYSTKQDAKNYLTSVVKDYENPKTFNWAIEIKNTHELIGSIGGTNLNEEVEKIDVGYCIGKKWWNNGFTTEALKEVIKFFFEKVGINRVQAYHDVRNIASGKVMQKCGMKLEGTLRKSYKFNYGVGDACIYGILSKDYIP